MVDNEDNEARSNGSDLGGEEGRRKKGSIPPMLTLSEALTATKEFYKKGGEGDKELFAVILEHSATSSILLKKTIALKRFNLIRVEGKGFKITDLGKTIAAPKNPAEYQKAAQRAFLSIPTYHTLYEKYKGAPLPLETYIVNTATEFVPDDLATEWVQSFKQAAKAAGLLEEHGDGTVVLLETPSGAKPPLLPLPGTSVRQPVRDSQVQQSEPQRNDERSDQELYGGQIDRDTIPIGRARRAYVWFPSDLTQDELKKFLKIVELTYGEESEVS